MGDIVNYAVIGFVMRIMLIAVFDALTKRKWLSRQYPVLGPTGLVVGWFVLGFPLPFLLGFFFPDLGRLFIILSRRFW